MDGVQEACEEATRFHEEISAVNHEIKLQDNVTKIKVLKRKGHPSM